MRFNSEPQFPTYRIRDLSPLLQKFRSTRPLFQLGTKGGDRKEEFFHVKIATKNIHYCLPWCSRKQTRCFHSTSRNPSNVEIRAIQRIVGVRSSFDLPTPDPRPPRIQVERIPPHFE